MKYFQLIKEIEIKASLVEVWNFIASPVNLKQITPPNMGFDITSENANQEMYPGMIIGYTVKPLLGIKTTWLTEITQVRHHEYFIDEQRIGPYKLWHHEHFIRATEDGVLMTDIVTYQPPFGFVGTIMNKLVIEKRLAEIFDYRTQALEKRFGN